MDRELDLALLRQAQKQELGEIVKSIDWELEIEDPSQSGDENLSTLQIQHTDLMKFQRQKKLSRLIDQKDEIVKKLESYIIAEDQYDKNAECYEKFQTDLKENLSQKALPKVLKELSRCSIDYLNAREDVETKPIHQKVLLKIYESMLRFYEQEDLETCIYILELIISYQPDFYHAWMSLGSCYRDLENHEAALNAFGFATILDTDAAMPHLLCAEIFLKMGEIDSASGCVEEAENFPEALNEETKKLQQDLKELLITAAKGAS